jgi:hypothetical protein
MAAKELPKVEIRFIKNAAMARLQMVILPQFIKTSLPRMFAPFKVTTELSNN